MFSYYKGRKTNLLSYIGRHLSRNIKWINDDNVIPLKEVNTWNRMDIATIFVDEYLEENTSDIISGIDNKEKFIYEVAINVDRLLPNTYFKKAKEYLEDKPFEYKGVMGTFKVSRAELEKQVVYHYEENTKEYKSMMQREPATEKQISYIKLLCSQNDMELIRENISKEYAKNIIRYLLEETLVKPTYFDMFIGETI